MFVRHSRAWVQQLRRNSESFTLARLQNLLVVSVRRRDITTESLPAQLIELFATNHPISIQA